MKRYSVEFENFMEISGPLNFKYHDWIKECLWFEHGMKQLNDQIGTAQRTFNILKLKILST